MGKARWKLYSAGYQQNDTQGVGLEQDYRRRILLLSPVPGKLESAVATIENPHNAVLDSSLETPVLCYTDILGVGHRQRQPDSASHYVYKKMAEEVEYAFERFLVNVPMMP